MKKCPFCAEEIQEEAIKCKHCGEMLNAPSKFYKEKNRFYNSNRLTVGDGVRVGLGMFIKLPLLIVGIITLIFISVPFLGKIGEMIMNPYGWVSIGIFGLYIFYCYKRRE